LDIRPFTGDNYYRLKIVSFSGEVEYSQIQTVTFAADKIAIYPNPVRDNINVEFNEATKDAVSFEIFSIYGQLIKTGVIDANNLSATINVSSLNLVPGTYLLNLHLSNNERVHKRFQKIN